MRAAAPKLVSVILPAYNEEQALPHCVPQLREVMEASGLAYEILVLDDGSRDRTAEIARGHGVRVVSHRRNYGVGRARKTGIIHAHGEIIVMADADGTYPVDRIPDLVAALETCDMVIGARTHEAGTMPLVRTVAKNGLRWLAGLITGTHIPDLNSGMRAFRRSDAMRFFNILPEGHSWVSTITLAYLTNGYDVEFVPIDYFKRIGVSTFHPVRDTYQYLYLIIRTVTFFNPLKFFLPLSIGLSIPSALKVLYDWLILSDVKESDIALVVVSVMIGVLGMLADLDVSHNRMHYMKPLTPEATPTLPEEPSDGSDQL